MLPDLSAAAEDTAVIGLLGGVGALFLAMGGTTVYRVMALRSRGVRVPGRITGARISTSSEGGTSSAATFEFTTVEGRHVHTTQPVSSSSNRLRAGHAVTVAYDPGDPERAEVVEAVTQLAGGLAFAAAGAALLIGGAVALARLLG
ncbi:uncharacterized protein DUF3592 [Murinocardiopsis flavida]|uniref:Uncharacterized protein DUF3592 n=1 Tax=Murinocardiopsis flavida TaxID=645275 RepID=A0A2P8D966_9ACTN|nr:DUF3592 domain-containing protein [Murinocardiopsis flavida]PSK93737.1 uncharacterized protein DUF3592 [Murinocardiopsis flavida]